MFARSEAFAKHTQAPPSQGGLVLGRKISDVSELEEFIRRWVRVASGEG
jgi:hypothetical protein